MHVLLGHIKLTNLEPHGYLTIHFGLCNIDPPIVIDPIYKSNLRRIIPPGQPEGK